MMMPMQFVFEKFQFWPPGVQKTAILGFSSAHRQDGPHVYYTKMTGYLDIHETFFKTFFELEPIIAKSKMAAIS